MYKDTVVAPFIVVVFGRDRVYGVRPKRDLKAHECRESEPILNIR